MFKVARVDTPSGLDETRQVMSRIYQENPSYWPHGLRPDGFDGGLYLVREKETNKAAGFCGWQERNEIEGNNCLRTGYYSIGILPEYRRNHYAKQAVASIIRLKSAGVDRVKAFVMSHNQPSLGLAKGLGVELSVKQAGAGRRLEQIPGLLRPWTKQGAGAVGTALEEAGRLFRSPVAEGILGKRMRTIARKGMTLHSDTGDRGAEYLMDRAGKMPGFLDKVFPDTGGQGSDWDYRLLSKFKQFPKSYLTADSTNAQLQNAQGLVFSPSHTITGPAAKRLAQQRPDLKTWQPTPTSFGEDKWREAQAFKGFVPPTHLLSQVLKGPVRSDAQFNQALNTFNQKLGPNWIIKPRRGLASKANSMMTESARHDLLRDVLRDPSNLDEHIIQQRNPMEGVPAWQQKLDNWIDPTANLNRGSRETRVHVLNGKVIPYSSTGRGSTTDFIMSHLRPWRDARTRAAEDYVTNMMGQMPAKHKANVLYGFDIGHGQDGKPFMIESNPTSPGGYVSGFMDMVPGIDSAAAAIQGRIPAWVKARNTAYGAAGALGLAGGTGVALGDKQASVWESRKEHPGRGVLELAAAGLLGDTTLSGVRALGLSDKMTQLHQQLLENPKLLGDPGQALRALDRYGALGGEASRLRVLGLPAGKLMARLPPSELSESAHPWRDAAAHLTGTTHHLPPKTRARLAEAAHHYQGFTQDPARTMAEEILTPSRRKLYSAGNLRQALGGEPGTPLIQRFGGILDQYYKAQGAQRRALGRPILDVSKELLLNGQRPASRVFSAARAMEFGPSAYAKQLIRPMAKGLIPLAALGAGGLAYSGYRNLTQ